jgi:hypothetical protein
VRGVHGFLHWRCAGVGARAAGPSAQDSRVSACFLIATETGERRGAPGIVSQREIRRVNRVTFGIRQGLVKTGITYLQVPPALTGKYGAAVEICADPDSQTAAKSGCPRSGVPAAFGPVLPMTLRIVEM